MAEIFEQHLRNLLRLLGHSNSWSLVHCHDTATNRIISRELLNEEVHISRWARDNNGKGNCFIGRAAKNSQGNPTVSNVLTLDIDPIREKGTAATEEQHQEALQAGREVITVLRYGILASSGNGALVLFPTGKPLDKQECETLGKALEAKAREILKGSALNGKVQVDSTWDHNRLIKLIGTKSTKGDIRLHRQTRFIDNQFSCDKGHERFMFGLTAAVSPGTGKAALPELSKGTLDRSRADFAIGVRLQAQGFSAEDTYRALLEYGFRDGREDDARRIVEKLYKSNVHEGVSNVRNLQLWTPANGIAGYTSRKQLGEPELPTGFKELDRATFGLVRGHIFTVGARTNNGKTTFAVTVSANLCRVRKRVLFISTETQYAEIWDRYIAASTGVSAFKLQHGLISPHDESLVKSFIAEFKDHGFYVYDGSRPNLDIIRRAVEQVNPDVLVIDYFQHVEGREVRELEDYVMSIKELAKEKQLAVLMAAQLHDGMINPKTNKLYPPTLGSMKNSKVLNDESHTVILLDWDRDSVQGDGPAAVKVLMGKNKGPKVDLVLKLDRSIPRFQEE